MPPIALKRREPLVKFVRRAARGHLDAADTALRAAVDGGKRAPARVAQGHRELLRLQALLRLIQGPMESDAFVREHGAVQRLVRRVTPHCESSHAAQDHPAAPHTRGAKAALLRALADLADIRVRAAHWHVPEAGFDALAPAVRRVWRTASRPITGPQALCPDARAQAALGLHDQLRCVERVWPEAIDAPRRLARALASDATRLAEIEAMTAQAVDAQAQARKTLTDARAKALADVNAKAQLLCAETPAAFTRRVATYWDLWRCVKA